MLGSGRVASFRVPAGGGQVWLKTDFENKSCERLTVVRRVSFTQKFQHGSGAGFIVASGADP